MSSNYFDETHRSLYRGSFIETIKPNYPEMLEQNIKDTKILAKALLDVMDMLYRMGSGEAMLKEYADSLIKIIKEEHSNDN